MILGTVEDCTNMAHIRLDNGLFIDADSPILRPYIRKGGRYRFYINSEGPRALAYSLEVVND